MDFYSPFVRILRRIRHRILTGSVTLRALGLTVIWHLYRMQGLETLGVYCDPHGGTCGDIFCLWLHFAQRQVQILWSRPEWTIREDNSIPF